VVEIYNATNNQLVKTFTSAANGGLTMNTTSGTWSINDASWTASGATGVSELGGADGTASSIGSYYTISYAVVADGSGGQRSTTQQVFRIVPGSTGQAVATVNDDTLSRVYSLDDGGYLLFYVTEVTNLNYDLFAQRYSNTGVANGGVINIATVAANSEGHSINDRLRFTPQYDVTVNGDGFFSVMYASTNGTILNYKNFNAAGIQVGATVTDNPATYELDPSFVKLDGGQYVGLFASGTISDYDMYMRLFNADGTTNGVLQRLTTGTNLNQGFSYDLAAAGTPTGLTNILCTPGNSSVYMGGTLFGMAYMSTKNNGASNMRSDLFLRVYDYAAVNTTNVANDGQLGTEVPLNTFTHAYQFAPVMVALSDGSYLGVWASNHGSGNGNNGTMDGVNVYSRRFSVNSTTGVVAFLDAVEVQVNTSTDGVNGSGFNSMTQYLNAAALTQGGYVVVWTKMTGLRAGEVYSQTFDSFGNKLGGETFVSAYPDTANRMDLAPAVAALADGGFVVSWTSAANTVDVHNNELGDIYRVIVNADGTIRNQFDTSPHLPLASFNATPVGNVLSGDAGVNTLDGVSGGALIINAGDDVDVIAVYNTGFTSVNGGAGYDTLVWRSTANLDFSSISSKVTNIEAIHLSDTNANQLTLTLADLINVSATKVLVVNGGATDSVDIELNAITAWGSQGIVNWRGQDYNVFGHAADPDAFLYVQTGINVI
jgi:hypothetical protein